MLSLIWSFFGWEEKPSPIPPPVTITGVRIPADGTSPHLLSLTTTSVPHPAGSFLFHVPDLRLYWSTKQDWQLCDLKRLDLLQDEHYPRSHHLRQKNDLERLLLPRQLTNQQLLHLRQRHLIDQQYCILQQQYSSCVGGYYLFYSFALDDLPENPAVPAWISDTGQGGKLLFYGDVFLVKVALDEYEEHGWAIYEDIVPPFLDLLVEGPLEVRTKIPGSLRESCSPGNASTQT
jgi:hypothetical protein